MFPFRYGRRNSGGNTRTRTRFWFGGVSKLDVFSSGVPTGPGGVVGWELRSGREQTMQELLW